MSSTGCFCGLGQGLTHATLTPQTRVSLEELVG